MIDKISQANDDNLQPSKPTQLSFAIIIRTATAYNPHFLQAYIWQKLIILPRKVCTILRFEILLAVVACNHLNR
jgi:hypothetical protein